ncbi:MAG TPA: MEDS domain-containing protein [Povalibacter sp.]
MIAAGHSGHFVQFFSNDAEWVRSVARFVKDGITADCTCVVVATAEHRARIAAHMNSLGLNAAALLASYQYIELDAVAMMNSFVHGNRLDPQQFHKAFNTLVRQASSRGEPVCIYGEMVNLLVERNQAEMAIELEELWNELSRHHTFTLFCGYSDPALASVNHTRETFARICATHSHVIAS